MLDATNRKPKPVPYVFQTRHKLLAGLSSEETAASVASFLAGQSDDIAYLVRTSVAGNTFRAFHLGKLNLKPSHVYRAWVTTRLNHRITDFQRADSVYAMRGIIVESAHALRAHWLRITSGQHDIGFGRAAKLLNLSFKHLLWHSSINSEERSALASLLDVPLDSFTLQGVRTLLPSLGITRNASMRFVQGEEHYVQIQNAIRELVGPNHTPFEYECLAWNMSHPKVMARLLSEKLTDGSKARP